MRAHDRFHGTRLSGADRKRLAAALKAARQARVYRRLEALLLVAEAATWVLALTPQQARRKAGMTSKRFWLRNLLQHFWLPT